MGKKSNNTEGVSTPEDMKQMDRSIMNTVLDHKNAVLEYCIFQLLKGDWADYGISEVSRMSGLETGSDYFFTAVIGIDEESRKIGLVALLRNIFCELFDVKYQSYLIGLTDHSCVLIVNGKEKFNLCEIKELLISGQQYLMENFHIAMFIGVGTIKKGLENISTSYHEAVETLQYKYLYGTNRVLMYEHIKGRNVDYRVVTDSKLYLQFMSFITGNEDCVGSQHFVNTIFQQYGVTQNTSVETARLFVAEIIGTVNNIMVSRNYNLMDTEEEVAVLRTAGSIKWFKVALAELLDTLYAKELEYTNAENVFCIKAKKYIKQNYSNNALSLGLVAKALGISDKYLAKCFKEGCNIKIQDYIAQTRILNGKRQLENTEDSIEEIANSCGFLSSGVFIKTFKKLENITPGSYRKFMTKRETEE